MTKKTKIPIKSTNPGGFCPIIRRAIGLAQNRSDNNSNTPNIIRITPTLVLRPVIFARHVIGDTHSAHYLTPDPSHRLILYILLESSMATGLWENITLLSSLVTGTVAVTFSLLTWSILRKSVIGQTVVVLTLVMSLFSIYHGIVFMSSQSELLAQILKSATLTGVLLFIGFTILFERRIAHDTSTRGES